MVRVDGDGMTSKKSTRRVTMSVSLSAETANKLEKAADNQGLSLSAYIRKAVEFSLLVGQPLSAVSPDLRNGQ